jgi:hypothetical protein
LLWHKPQQKKTKQKRLQNPVDFAEALAVFRPPAYKTAVFRGRFFKTEILKKPQQPKHFFKTIFSSWLPGIVIIKIYQ